MSSKNSHIVVDGIEINPSIFRDYDIRGVADHDPQNPDFNEKIDLSPRQAWIIGKAYGTWLQRNLGPEVVIGRDNRKTSLDLASGLILGLLSSGCKVVDIGLCSSPMLYFSVGDLCADGGVMVTGSHNPMWSNGLKFSRRGYQTLVGSEILSLLEMTKAQDFNIGEGQYRAKSMKSRYIEAIIARTKVATRPLKVVVDPGNATGGLVAPEILSSLGYDIFPINAELVYPFPSGAPDPEQPGKLRELAKQVIKIGADIGIAYDGDSDRVGVIDEKGKKIESDLLLLLFARDLLRENPGAEVVFDVKCSDILISDIRSRGGIPVMTKTGHSNIKQKMTDDLKAGIPALLGGELSGHMFFRDRFYGFDDAIYASCRILEILSSANSKLSDLLADLPKMYTTRELALPCPDEKKVEIISKLQERFKQTDFNVIDIDGVRIDFEELKWALVRKSNTQPKLTARFQAPNVGALKEIIELVKKELHQYPSIDLSDIDDGYAEIVSTQRE